MAEVVEAPAPVLVAENRAPEAQQLPKTASQIPLIALIGMASLGLAFVARRFATQRS
jgi:LPXTG-motif cell wall-anchored protein